MTRRLRLVFFGAVVASAVIAGVALTSTGRARLPPEARIVEEGR